MNDWEQQVIAKTKKWLLTVVIGFSFCPFAKRVEDEEKIRYAVVGGQGMENSLHALVEELEQLDADDNIETTLVIFPDAFQSFDEYLDLVHFANEILTDQDYEGIYQIASFHPDYCFDGEEWEDAANFTNRSPYPMLHILREASLAAALDGYPADPDVIPERNIKLARETGYNILKAIFEACFEIHP